VQEREDPPIRIAPPSEPFGVSDSSGPLIDLILIITWPPITATVDRSLTVTAVYRSAYAA
jgi:hypothetical protein